VHKAGFGWYWFAPVFFVDTSDMWLGSRRQRVIVSLAGPYSTLVLAGVLMSVAVALPPVALAVVWTLALPIYLSVLLNLDPILEYDGYYVLTDLLRRPNLRREALGRFRAALRRPSSARGHVFDIAYGIAAVLYVAVMAAIVSVLYLALLRPLVEYVLPAWLAGDLAWVVALLVGSVGVASLWSEMKAAGVRASRVR
jgi:putative peptide zinc metalloprotease protein